MSRVGAMASGVSGIRTEGEFTPALEVEVTVTPESTALVPQPYAADAGLPGTLTTVAGSGSAGSFRLQPVTWLGVIPNEEEATPETLPEPVEVRLTEPASLALT